MQGSTTTNINASKSVIQSDEQKSHLEIIIITMIYISLNCHISSGHDLNCYYKVIEVVHHLSRGAGFESISYYLLQSSEANVYLDQIIVDNDK